MELQATRKLGGWAFGSMNKHGVSVAQLEHIEAIEKRLWGAADTLRANSNYASNEYFLPVMGLVFLRHAYSRFLAVKDKIEANLPTRGGKRRGLSKEDFSQQGSIFLQSEAQFDHLVALPDSADRAKAIIKAMDSIEADYENLRGILPKSEYQELDNDVLGQLLRTLNPDVLKKVSGDVFGRIYEYFLTQLADQKAITYYEDPHELVGKADFVMANPPFNVDEIDADKVKTDPRLPFGLPGVNKKEKVSNGNYVWISYFYSYLNEQGKAGFVMSSQASSAGGGEAKVRRKLVESGDVDVMVAIRSNFFYTRTVPCELWFLNRDKPDAHRDKVLMIDARNVYRKVTRKIFDFSPEQQQNLLAIVWLHRGQTDRYLELVSGYCRRSLNEGTGCFNTENESGKAIQPLPDFAATIQNLIDTVEPSIETLLEDAPHAEVQKELTETLAVFRTDVDGFQKALAEQEGEWKSRKATNGELKKAVDRLAPLAEISRNLVKQSDLLYKLASRLVEALQKAPSPQPSPSGRGGNHTALRKMLRDLDEVRQVAVEQLKQVRYFWKQARWLTERFPEARLRDVEGLVKLVDVKEIEANDWSLTPGRYVGVAPEEEDENFDFEETLREIHVELEDLNAEAVILAATIKKNFEELGA